MPQNINLTLYNYDELSEKSKITAFKMWKDEEAWNNNLPNTEKYCPNLAFFNTCINLLAYLLDMEIDYVCTDEYNEVFEGDCVLPSKEKLQFIRSTFFENDYFDLKGFKDMFDLPINEPITTDSLVAPLKKVLDDKIAPHLHRGLIAHFERQVAPNYQYLEDGIVKTSKGEEGITDLLVSAIYNNIYSD